MSEYKKIQTGLSADENISSLFQPDTLLADQYLENFRRKNPLEPEKTLLLAVLEDGVRTFQDNVFAKDEKKRKLFEEARDWLFTDDSDWLFSFVSVCTVLGLEPGYIRRGLEHWEKGAQVKAQKKPARALKTPQRLVA